MKRLGPKIRQELRRLGVALAYLFGSEAEGVASPLSDVDLGVLFKVPPRETNETYLKLYDLFTDLFPGREVDIVSLHRAALELRGDVVRHGIVLYQTSPDERAAFEERTLLACADFAPVQREMDRAILARM